MVIVRNGGYRKVASVIYYMYAIYLFLANNYDMMHYMAYCALDYNW